MAKVAEWVGGKRIRLEKQYRMTEDGFKRAVWKEKCGDKGPLLHVLESDQGKRFGGYSHVKWPKIDAGKYHPDPKAFLFSLTHLTKHQVRKDSLKNALRTYSSLTSSFGYGGDLYIYDEANPNDNYSNFGSTYELPEGI